ncbi:MAG: hypothetical protein GF333_02035 [Candidatus Omnitrophica bacterium]|nr:hypothetical protein [Candidatus Omnitrophota bacterium]
MELSEEVLQTICETLEVKKEECPPEQKLYDSIGVDSTEMVELVVALNKRFGIKIETNEITKFSTPSQICEIVANKKA